MLANRNLSWQVFLIFWLLTNIIASVLFYMFTLELDELLKRPFFDNLGTILLFCLLALAGTSIIFGTMQWITLRLKIPKVSWWWWVLAIIRSITLGLLFLYIVLFPSMFVVSGIFYAVNLNGEVFALWIGSLILALFLGTTLGKMQSLILQREIARPSLWVVANIVGMALVAIVVISLEYLEPKINIIFKGIIMGTVFSIPTGAVLLKLLYFSPSQKNA